MYFVHTQTHMDVHTNTDSQFVGTVCCYLYALLSTALYSPEVINVNDLKTVTHKQITL